MSLSLQTRQKNLIDRFTAFSSWEDRYREIIEAGKRLPAFPEAHRLDQFKVSGCQSQVWLFPELRGERVFFHADSDALITKGLIALLLELYSDATPEEILGAPPEFIQALGLESKLSPSRANGLFSMIKQIKFYAVALQAKLHSSIR